jgi:prepilin-type N-terminal cleavage/methylation domain-containing protein
MTIYEKILVLNKFQGTDMKWNNRGVTLIEIMVVSALLGGVALIVMNLTKDSFKSSTKYQYDMEVTSTVAEMNRILSSTDSCSKTFNGVTATNGASPTINKIWNTPPGGTIAVPTTPVVKYENVATNASAAYGNAKLQIESFTLSNISLAVASPATTPASNKGTAVLTIKFVTKKILNNSPQVQKIIKLDIETWVNTAAGPPAQTANKISKCTSASGSSGGTGGGGKLIGLTDDLVSFLGVGAGGVTTNGGASTVPLGNTGAGFNALHVTTGVNNTAIGSEALAVNTRGGGNTAVGYQAMIRNVDGNHNTAAGYLVLKANVSGSGNTAYGINSLSKNTGSKNTAYGNMSLQNSVAGSESTAFGYMSLQGPTNSASASVYNTALGYMALNANNMAQHNVAVGWLTMQHTAGASTTVGGDNTGVGTSALYNNTEGYANTAVGYNSLNTYQGIYGTAIGSEALDNNTARYNTAVGLQALKMNNSSEYNTAIGDHAMSSNTGTQNTAAGSGAFAGNTAGATSTALGYNALKMNSNSSSNLAIGSQALYRHNNHEMNTMIGYKANQLGLESTQSTGLGYQTLLNSTGSWNVAIGYNSGSDLDSGSQNTLIGSDTGATFRAKIARLVISSSGTEPFIRMVGYANEDSTYIEPITAPACNYCGDILHLHVLCVASSAYYVGGCASYQGGSFEITGTLKFAGAAMPVYTSDIRLKKDIINIPDALNKLLSIDGVSYNWNQSIDPELNLNDQPQMGVIAQQVEKIFPAAVSNSGKGFKTVAYNMLLAPIIEAIKDLYHNFIMRLWSSDQKHKAEIAELLIANENLKLEKDKEIAALNATLEGIEKAVKSHRKQGKKHEIK